MNVRVTVWCGASRARDARAERVDVLQELLCIAIQPVGLGPREQFMGTSPNQLPERDQPSPLVAAVRGAPAFHLGLARQRERVQLARPLHRRHLDSQGDLFGQDLQVAEIPEQILDLLEALDQRLCAFAPQRQGLDEVPEPFCCNARLVRFLFLTGRLNREEATAQQRGLAPNQVSGRLPQLSGWVIAAGTIREGPG